MNKKVNQDGFSYIDVMISITVLMVGVLALTGALAANMMRSYQGDKQIIAKQLALSTMESIFAARDIAKSDGVKGWDSIGNVGNNVVNDVPQGIFVAGWTPVREDYGKDGVVGTADDACAAGVACPQGDGTTLQAPEIVGIERKIEITDVATPSTQAIVKRRIAISIRYRVNSGASREEKIETLIGNYN